MMSFNGYLAVTDSAGGYVQIDFKNFQVRDVPTVLFDALAWWMRLSDQERGDALERMGRLPL